MMRASEALLVMARNQAQQKTASSFELAEKPPARAKPGELEPAHPCRWEASLRRLRPQS
jgi:hypothetical protein